MGFIESIGWLVIIFCVGYFLLNSLANKKINNNELKELILNNDRCNEIIRKETKIIYGSKKKILRIESDPVFDEQGEIINNKIKKDLLQIINDPAERQKAKDNIIEKQKQEEKRKQELYENNKKHRKIGYKYELEIFEIFGNKRELSKIDLIQMIEAKFHINNEKAIDIFKIWKDNWLIEECDWNSDNYKVGWTLTVASEFLDKSDLSWDKWLRQNNIALEPMSKEYLDYIKD